MSINVVGRVVNGTSGNDIGLTGGSGDDRIQGLDGNDTILGNAGADINDGGNGNDTVDYSASQAGIGVDLGQNWGTGGDAQGDTYISIENITGSAFSDTIFGDGHSNVLNGGAGNDYLYGMDGNDTLRGGDGNDVLQGGNGSDIIVGGDGNDVITGGADGDSLDGGAGNNTLSYAGSQAGVSINLSTSVVQFGDAEGDKIRTSPARSSTTRSWAITTPIACLVAAAAMSLPAAAATITSTAVSATIF